MGPLPFPGHKPPCWGGDTAATPPPPQPTHPATLTGRLVQLHHQGLQGVERLELLLLIPQVLLQQLGLVADDQGVQAVGVLDCRRQGMRGGQHGQGDSPFPRLTLVLTDNGRVAHGCHQGPDKRVGRDLLLAQVGLEEGG